MGSNSQSASVSGPSQSPSVSLPSAGWFLCSMIALLYRITWLALAAPGFLMTVPSLKFTRNMWQHSSKPVASFDLSRCGQNKMELYLRDHLSVPHGVLNPSILLGPRNLP